MSGDPPRSDGVSDAVSTRTARVAIVLREWRSLRTEKTIVLAIAIQLVIAAFSSFLVVGLVTLYDPASVDGYETDIAVTGDDSEELLDAAAGQDGIAATHLERSAAFDAFESRDVATVLDASRDDEGRLAVRITAPDGGLETTLLIVQLRDLLEAVELDERLGNADRLEHPPVAVPPEEAASPYVGFTYTILVPLLCFLPVFISGSIAVDSLLEERRRGTLELLRVAPPTLSDIVDAKLVATAALAPIQATLWLVLLAANGTNVADPTALVVLVAALSALVVAGGLGVALTAPDRRQAQLLFSGAIVGALILASLLPEHPANTVAKFAIGAATTTTWALLVGYCAFAVLAYAGLRVGIRRLNIESL